MRRTAVSTAEPATVVLVDDTPDIRFLLRLALDLEDDFTVVGEAADGRQGVAVAVATQPDLILLDLAMPGMDGLEALPLLRARCPDATILVLSGFDEASLAPYALADGADGYVRKGAPPREIVGRARQLRGARVPGTVPVVPVVPRGSGARAVRAARAGPVAVGPGGSTAPAAAAPRSSTRRTVAPGWSVSDRFVETAPFGLLRLSPDEALEVQAANQAGCAALGLGGTVLPVPLAQVSSTLETVVRRQASLPDATSTGADVQARAGDLRTLDDYEVHVHRDGDGDGASLLALLMPLGSTTEAVRLRRAIAATAHELRNPVTVLTGAVQALADHRERLDQDMQDRLLEAVHRQAGLLERATADLLASAQQHRDRLDVSVAEVPVRTVLEACVQAVAVAEHVPVECPEHLVVLADRGRLEQMVANLLSNALKYGAAPIAVSASVVRGRDIRGDHDAGMVAIRVSDAGPGATEEFVPFLFDEFTRERGRSAQGTGLGLYVVRGLAIAQAGSVDYARIGDRTVFTIRLPSAAGSGHRHRVSDPAGDPAAAESSDD